MRFSVNGTIPLNYKIATCRRCSASTVYQTLNAPTLAGWHHAQGSFTCKTCATRQNLQAIKPEPPQEAPSRPSANSRAGKVLTQQRRDALRVMLASGQALPSLRALGRQFQIEDASIWNDLRMIKREALGDHK